MKSFSLGCVSVLGRPRYEGLPESWTVWGDAIYHRYFPYCVLILSSLARWEPRHGLSNLWLQ